MAIDRLTKCVHLIAMSNPYAVAKVGALYVQNMFKLHGMPSSIVSDIDPVITVAFWEELMRLQCVELGMSFSYHPQIDGQTKAV